MQNKLLTDFKDNAITTNTVINNQFVFHLQVGKEYLDIFVITYSRRPGNQKRLLNPTISIRF